MSIILEFAILENGEHFNKKRCKYLLKIWGMLISN